MAATKPELLLCSLSDDILAIIKTATGNHVFYLITVSSVSKIGSHSNDSFRSYYMLHTS